MDSCIPLPGIDIALSLTPKIDATVFLLQTVKHVSVLLYQIGQVICAILEKLDIMSLD